jgi:radical SAM protein with 4Fe4S-binding SPASM domain
LESYICDVGGASICISELGLVYPCAGWQSCILGSAENQTIANIWYNSDKLTKLRTLKRCQIAGCAECPAFQFCEPCLVRNANESYTHNPLEKSEFFCEIAKIRKRNYAKYNQNK